jgi:hypothetical protein
MAFFLLLYFKATHAAGSGRQIHKRRLREVIGSGFRGFPFRKAASQ